MARVTSGRYTGFVRFDQINRLTGTEYRLFDLEAVESANEAGNLPEGFDLDAFLGRVEEIGTRWVLECVEHDRIRPAENLFEARTKMGHPELWCKDCQDVLVEEDVLDYEVPDLNEDVAVAG